MSTCPHCGTQGNGSFCGNCGKPLPPAQQQAPAYQQPQYQQPYPQQQWVHQPPPKKSSTGLWLAIGGGLLAIVAVVITMLGGGDGGTTPAGGSGSAANSGGGGGGSSAQSSGMGFEYNTTYGLAIPGAAYTESAGGDKVRYVLSTGTKTKSTVQIKPDGTYVWDSAWDGKVIKGNWEKTGDAGYPIVLRKAQEGKDWRIGADTRSGAKPGTILVWEGSIYYTGYPLK